ncbi:MAG: transporter [Gemmatimonadetes bacterium]|nr:transporter [Gemmatimonadota bacterium]
MSSRRGVTRGLPRLALAGVLGSLALAAEAPAQAIPFHTPTAMPLPLAESSIRSFFQHIEMRSVLRDGEEILNRDRVRLGIDLLPLVVPYGVTPTTTVMAGIPYVWKTFRAGGGASRSNRGFGDAFLVVKQELLARDFIAGNRRLAVFGGASFPTGETQEDGVPLAAALRLGAGTVNPIGQAVYSHVHDRLGVHARLGYSRALGSEFGVRPGSQWLYDLALGYRLSPAVYQSERDATLAAYLEVNGAIVGRATRQGDPVSDTGGHTIFLSPGVQLIPLPNWAFEASFQLPILRELRGTQLGPDWSLAIGARTVFYPFGP